MDYEVAIDDTITSLITIIETKDFNVRDIEADYLIGNLLDNLLIGSEKILGSLILDIENIILELKVFMSLMVAIIAIFSGILVGISLFIEIKQTRFKTRFFESFIKLESKEQEHYYEKVLLFNTFVKKSLEPEKVSLATQNYTIFKRMTTLKKQMPKKNVVKRRVNFRGLFFTSFLRIITNIIILFSLLAGVLIIIGILTPVNTGIVDYNISILKNGDAHKNIQLLYLSFVEYIFTNNNATMRGVSIDQAFNS